MVAVAHRQPPPNAQEAALARVSGQHLSRFADRNSPLTLQVEEEPLELPASAVALLMDILEAMAAGRDPFSQGGQAPARPHGGRHGVQRADRP